MSLITEGSEKLNAGDLLSAVPDASNAELLETIINLDGICLERIISKGQATPAGYWYDQPWHEWVLLAAGEALLLIEGETEPRRLCQGQWIMLPARCRHRVEWTLPEQNTIWLAVNWPVASEDRQTA